MDSMRPTAPRATPNINAQLYYLKEEDVLKSKITFGEKCINLLFRLARKLFSRKINVFTQNVDCINNKTYLRLSFNKHIQLFRDIENTEDNNKVKVSGEDGLKQNEIEKLAQQAVNEELTKTTDQDNDPITIKIPPYSTNPSEENQSYEQYIDHYIHTVDLCLRMAKKDLQIKHNRKLKIVFSSKEPNIIQAENLALKKLNTDVFSSLDRYIENNNQEILRLIENRPQGIYRGQYNSDTEYKTDKKIASITKNLDNCAEIETQRQDIENKLNSITAQDIDAEKEKIQSELEKNECIDFGVIKICAGEIQNTNKLDMRNAYIMNAANPFGADGGGVTGSIYKASGHSKDITQQFQQELKNNQELTRKNDNNQPIKSNGRLKLEMGKVLVTDAFDIANTNGIIHAVAPNINHEDSILKGKNDTEVAIAANSFEKAIRLAASKKNDPTKPCDSIALVLLGGQIYGGNQLNILTALKIASGRLENDPIIKDLDIRLITYNKVSSEQQEIIAKLRAADAIQS